ncbi:hypothetical protein Fmac_032891 [Flemingia macrophylla]|uniref:Uncharacterized protein n=1 Tax=Flemingia macrophylla TaxID=520843 RepID=A0ABD1L670_9FABA
MRIRSLPLLQESAVFVLPMTTILVSVLLRSNLEWISILRLLVQTPIVDYHSSRDKALDREDASQLLAKLEGKLDALVNLVTQQAMNQKSASVARVCSIHSSNDHQTSVCPSSQQSGVDGHPRAYSANTYKQTVTTRDTRHLMEKMRFKGARNDVIVIRGVHDVATNISAETRKLEGKLDALVNLVTQLAANQKPTSVARVCNIRSSNDHRTSFSARNDAIVIRGVHDVAIDTFAETTKLEGKLDALVKLVTQLAANQEPVFVARVWGIRSSNFHHASFSARNDVIAIRGVHDVPTDTSTETRKLEGKLDTLVNLLTQLAANRSLPLVARVCDIRSSNDHHTSVCPSSQQSGLDEHPEAYAANTYSRPPQQ